MQDIVYKLVPELFKSERCGLYRVKGGGEWCSVLFYALFCVAEQIRREQFYTERGVADPSTSRA